MPWLTVEGGRLASGRKPLEVAMLDLEEKSAMLQQNLGDMAAVSKYFILFPLFWQQGLQKQLKHHRVSSARVLMGNSYLLQN